MQHSVLRNLGTMSRRPTIVLFGDSITELGFSQGGWTSLLAGHYSRRADILNRGFSGYNTRHAIDILSRVFGESKEDAASRVGSPLFVTCFFGANDAMLDVDVEHCQHVPVDEYETNIRSLVSTIRKRLEVDNRSPPVILFTPPPVDQKAWDDYCVSEFGCTSPRTNDAAKLYGDRVKNVGQELGCSIVDSFELLGGNGEVSEYGKNLDDGLHLNEKGNGLLFDGLVDVIRRDLPDLEPNDDFVGKEKLKGVSRQGKYWKDLC
mmetsp:Transcript_22551/g.53234  ORF Transcript_22551/g.53234 Transcript_22551/m.53234 type:complete len:263 (+) Transcript_22551:84-872(+)